LNRVSLSERFLYQKKIPLELNSDISKDYNSVLKFGNKLSSSNEKIVLILTEDYSEENILTSKEELDIIKSLIKIINGLNIRVIIKPHPVEKEDKYKNILEEFDNVKIINNGPIAEKIIPYLNPICVFGYSSTALINASLLYNITSVSLINIIISDNEKFLFYTNKFKKFSKNCIEFVNSIDEIKKFILIKNL
jgi:hypothetical protein